KNETGGRMDESGLRERESRYRLGGDGWWDRVFSAGVDFQLVAREEQFYELARMWLLGSWIADRLSLKFTLASLTLPDKEVERLEQFRRHLSEVESRGFSHLTWRDVLSDYQQVSIDSLEGPARLLKDLQLGYTGAGKLVRAGL
ncbi:MAG: hypothetical protein KC931_17380, partial [Candidatus Omnitrophica bacterium]|nr:hypothetical protein [Candidatus Omnitrophota bacterium]